MIQEAFYAFLVVNAQMILSALGAYPRCRGWPVTFRYKQELGSGKDAESIKLVKYLALIIDQKFREAHYVHEQDVGDFEMKLRFTL